MEISNAGGQQPMLWPSQFKTKPAPPQFALKVTLSNVIDKTLVNIKLDFKVDFRMPRQGGGIVATDPIDSSRIYRATIALIPPHGNFEFIIANRSVTHAAQPTLSTQATIQIAGESAPRRILITMPEVSIIDALGSMPLFPATIGW
jgi:hypothetical protein